MRLRFTPATSGVVSQMVKDVYQQLEQAGGAVSKLEQARLDRGWTQHRLIAELRQHAAAAGSNLPCAATLKAQISRWENGHQRPDARYRKLLKQSYGLNDRELGFDQSHGHSQAHHERPSLSKHLETATTIDIEVLGLVRDQLDQLRTLDRKLGARHVLPQTRALGQSVHTWIRYSTVPSERTKLAHILADCSALAGWQSLDIGQLDSAWDHFERAKDAAREAEDIHLQFWAAAEQAYVLAELGRHSAAVNLIDHYRMESKGRVKALLRCWLVAASAELHAQAGNIDTARGTLDKSVWELSSEQLQDDLPYVVLDRANLTRWRGHVLARLGDEAAIVELVRAAAAIEPSFVRASASLNADLAMAHLQLGRQDDARTHAVTARRLAQQIGSRRITRRISKIAA